MTHIEMTKLKGIPTSRTELCNIWRDQIQVSHPFKNNINNGYIMELMGRIGVVVMEPG